MFSHTFSSSSFFVLVSSPFTYQCTSNVVGSILTGIVSFMNSDEMTTGGISTSSAERKALALASKAYNAKDKVSE